MITKLSLPAFLTLFLSFTVHLAWGQDFLVLKSTGDTLTGKILKETSEFLMMQPDKGEKMKVTYDELRSYSYKDKVYERRSILQESGNEDRFVADVIKGKVNLYMGNSWTPTSFAMSPGGGSGMTASGGGKMIYYYIDKTGESGGLQNPIATGMLSEKRLLAARKLLLDLMGDDELLAFKISNSRDFDVPMITHYVTEYNKRNPL